MSTFQSGFENEEAQGSFLPSAILIGSVFALLSSIISLAAGYMTISQDPSGSPIGPMAVSGIVVCLVTAFAGTAAVWHFSREVTRTITFGQGALIGFATAAAITIVSVLLTQIWYLIDPEYLDNLTDALIENFEIMGLPDEAIDSQIDQIVQAQTITGVLKNAAISLALLGFLNSLTGMLGVRLFAERPQI